MEFEGDLVGIKTYSLNTSTYTEVAVPDSLIFDKIVITSSDGTQVNIRYDESGGEYFPLNNSDLNTMPIIIAQTRRSSGYSTRLFDAISYSGSPDLCIMFYKNIL